MFIIWPRLVKSQLYQFLQKRGDLSKKFNSSHLFCRFLAICGSYWCKCRACEAWERIWCPSDAYCECLPLRSLYHKGRICKEEFLDSVELLQLLWAKGLASSLHRPSQAFWEGRAFTEVWCPSMAAFLSRAIDMRYSYHSHTASAQADIPIS